MALAVGDAVAVQCASPETKFAAAVLRALLEHVVVLVEAALMMVWTPGFGKTRDLALKEGGEVGSGRGGEEKRGERSWVRQISMLKVGRVKTYRCCNSSASSC